MNLLLPASIKQQFNAPEHSKNPSWRWLLIMQYLADYTQPVAFLAADALLCAGARYFRSARDPLYRREDFDKTVPHLVEAFRIFNATWPNGPRWMMEALLMTGEDDNVVADQMRLVHGEDTVACYRHLFFDVKSYLEDELLVTSNVMARSMVLINQHNIYDYTWKLIAWRYGVEGLRQFVSPKAIPDKDMLEWMGYKAVSNLSKEAFHISHAMSHLYCEQTFAVYTTATKFWDIDQSDKQQIQSDATRKALDSLMSSVKIVLKDPVKSKKKFDPFDYGSDINWDGEDLAIKEFVQSDIPEQER